VQVFLDEELDSQTIIVLEDGLRGVKLLGDLTPGKSREITIVKCPEFKVEVKRLGSRVMV